MTWRKRLSRWLDPEPTTSVHIHAPALLANERELIRLIEQATKRTRRGGGSSPMGVA